MVDLIVIILSYCLYWTIEIFHDDILRRKNNSILGLMRLYSKVNNDYNPNYEKEYQLTSKWHSLDWKGHALLALLVGYLATTVLWIIPIYALMIASLRVLILNIGGNIKSKRKLLYVGERGIESKFKNKEIIYYILWLLIFVVSLYSIIKIEI